MNIILEKRIERWVLPDEKVIYLGVVNFDGVQVHLFASHGEQYLRIGG